MGIKLSVLGLPGAGKGTQSERISETYNVPAVSMGGLLRAESDAIIHYNPENKETDGDLYFYENRDVRRTQKPDQLPEYQETIGTRLARGEGPSTATSAYFLEQRLAEPDCADGYVIDGFPRWDTQAEAMDDIDILDAILYLDVSEDEIYRRLGQRGREDDTPDAIANRISWQRDGMEEVLAHYTEHDSVPIETIDADRSIDAVWTDVQTTVNMYADGDDE